MTDRDYLPIFPSWRLFLLFNLVCYMGIYSMAMTTVSFIKYFPPEYVLMVPQIFVLIFFLACYQAFFGRSGARFFLAGFNIVMIIISIFKSFIDSDKDFIWLQISVAFVSIISCALIFSPWYKSFLTYRFRHVSVIRKVKNGEPLDDGSFYQLGSYKLAFTKHK